MTRRVTTTELEHGWQCETCNTPFIVGDAVYGCPVAYTSDGTLIEGDYRCLACWAGDD